jgi:hypothetical protein
MEHVGFKNAPVRTTLDELASEDIAATGDIHDELWTSGCNVPRSLVFPIA